MWAYLPVLDSLSGKRQKKRNFAQLRRAAKHQFKRAILVRTSYPERPSTISQHTRFNCGPVTRIKGASLQIQSQTTSPSSFTCSVVSKQGGPWEQCSTQVGCTPDVSAYGGLLLPLTHWMLQKPRRGGGMERRGLGRVHSVHHRQRNTRDLSWKPKLPLGQH